MSAHPLDHPHAAFSEMSTKPTQMLLLRQRVERVFELVDAVASNNPLGVHLSGPTGVGKSAIALLAYLVLAAREIPVVYLQSTATWVDAARVAGGGHSYFLGAFWRQNADIIVDRPALRKIFAAALLGKPAPHPSVTMEALRRAVGTPALPAAAVIMDEVEHITKEVKASEKPAAPACALKAGGYFATNWFDGTHDNAAFQRMFVASSHALRDTKLPDGEAHCLRFIEPLDPADREALQKAPESPAYLKDYAARERAVFIGGNVLRKFIAAGGLLPRHRKPTAADFSMQWAEMFSNMVADCRAWLNSVPASERTEAARSAMGVIKGEILSSRTSGLYDAGIVYRTTDSPVVRPVSAAACAAILRATAEYTRSSKLRLADIKDGSQRGKELERQVLARLDGFNLSDHVPAKLLNGSPTSGLDLRSEFSLPFDKLSELEVHDVPVLYLPTDTNYPCDAILMPAAQGGTGTVSFIEISIRDPLEAERVDKVHGYVTPRGVVTLLLKQHPGLTPTVVLIYDSELADRTCQELPAKVVALSEGRTLPPASAPVASTGAGAAAADGAATSSGGPGAGAAAAESAATLGGGPGAGAAAGGGSNTASGDSKRGRPSMGSPDAAPKLGNVVRVVDGPFLATALFIAVK
jgi:hypothetical protein